MKKFFGFNKKDPPPPPSTPSLSPNPNSVTPSSSNGSQRDRQNSNSNSNNQSNSAQVGATKNAHGKPNPGLGLLQVDFINPGNGYQDDSEKGRKSRHVQFESSNYSTGSGEHTLQSQPSFESRHGNPAASAAANCFPRPSQAEQLQQAMHDRPGLPKASVPVGVGADLSLQRTTSPLSFSPSSISYGASSRGGGVSPYGGGVFNPSLARLGDRDPSAIYQPLTWSEMAHHELVENVSARERTRQEILWEVVASEERYVHELRSLVELYVNPLLHPLLSPPTSPAPSSNTSSPYLNASTSSSSSPSTNYPSSSKISSSKEELPIAARFLRSISNNTTSGGGNPNPIYNLDDWENGLSPEMPEIDSDSSHGGRSNNRSRQSLPVPPRGQDSLSPLYPQSASATSLNLNPYSPNQSQLPPRSGSVATAPVGGNFNSRFGSSFPSFRPRHPLRGPPSASKLHKSSSKAPAEFLVPPPIPQGLRNVLEAIPEMLRGHEELSSKLKEQWIKAFPLVRGLALIWSDQPWFLEVYAKYIVSLEEALETIDVCLPSTHSPHVSLTLLNKKAKSQSDKDTKRLAKFIMTIEERASVEGEAGLAIAISKPLMRLGKLPLLMQSLLYHTDATTVEYEKTRAMALEVDALVRSIEDEKIEEDEREKVRDVLARIDGIKDKALMAPRSSRILLEEVPVIPTSPTSPSEVPPPLAPAPRRAVSETAPSRRPSAPPPNATIINGPSKKSTKRLSDVMGRGGMAGAGGADDKKDWFIRFSDVEIRCTKIGTTDIPGGFSREKEKVGKQGKTKKKGKVRNLYRFVRVERWEMREMSDKGLVSMEDISRSRTDLADGLHEASEEEEEDDFDDGVSRMSFSYEGDDPKPSAPRNFKDIGLPRATSRRSPSRATSSQTTRSVITKQGATADAKFGGRLPSSSVGPSGKRFEAPTAASLARATPNMSRNMSPASRVASPQSLSPPPPLRTAPVTNPPPTTTNPPAKRGLSSPAMPSSTAPAEREKERTRGAATLQPKKSLESASGKFGAHGRDASTIGMYEAFWSEDASAVPFPRT